MKRGITSRSTGGTFFALWPRSLSSWSVGSAFLSSALRLSTFTGSLHLAESLANRSSQEVVRDGRKTKGRGEIEAGMLQGCTKHMGCMQHLCDAGTPRALLDSGVVVLFECVSTLDRVSSQPDPSSYPHGWKLAYPLITWALTEVRSECD